jgi:hypothetical protein
MKQAVIIQPPGSRLRVLKRIEADGTVGEQIFCSSNKSMVQSHVKQCQDWAKDNGYEIVDNSVAQMP